MTRAEEIERALRALLTKLDAIREATNDIFVLADVHGREYSGPNWAEEYKAGREALALPADPLPQVSQEQVKKAIYNNQSQIFTATGLVLVTATLNAILRGEQP